jgi:hypothetical protein
VDAKNAMTDARQRFANPNAGLPTNIGLSGTTRTVQWGTAYWETGRWREAYWDTGRWRVTTLD